ncbi:unnamed protein product [Bemisia tabaci]|uniref:TOG domain-containing protein n=1 Tax=Bemisia tabaci TaxID=7038 RepID=A0A9P0ADC2_BEMTA|nr:PREDICTED: importin-5 [Bemisia tabaci]CAH0388175.1 unnamed protein product [Bemisia tabaci]
MATEREQFHKILVSLLSIDNNVRTQAEETYHAIPLENRVMFLLNAIPDASLQQEERMMAAVLLRRVFSNDFSEMYPTLSPENQQQLKDSVLMLVQNEESEAISKKLCDVVAELARNLVDDDGNNGWQEFLLFLFSAANSESPRMKEAALRIFAQVPGVFGNQQPNYLDVIKQMLNQSLCDGTYEVRFQAVRALCAFISLHEEAQDIQKFFTDLLPVAIHVIAESCEKEDDDTLLKALVDLCETVPKFLRPQLEAVVQLCIKVFSDENRQNEFRHLALEIFVTLSETAPAMMRKVGGKYIPIVVPQILKMMTEIEDDAEWTLQDEIADDDADENNVIAESALDRLACGLGGKTMLPHIVENIPTMLANPDWKYRHAALMAVSAVGEGCYKQMEAMLPQIMEGILRFLADEHPRVRYAACNAIGQMSTDFGPNFQKKFHDKVIPALLMILDDEDNPRVQAHGGAALVNFCEECPKRILADYLDGVMAKLESVLQAKLKQLMEKGTKLVLEQVVTTIASVADAAEDQFVKFYDRLMPCLKYIIQNANSPELRMLRGKAIECVSLIGFAVGADKFVPDCSDIMDMLLKTQSESNEPLPDDDPQTSYLISAWARICKILGKRFEQYLPLVIGPVMKTAGIKPEVVLVDNEAMEDIGNDVDWQFVSLGEQKNFGIRTAGLEDKAAACEMLVCYARELKEGFAPYTEEVVKLLVPLLKFCFHDGVRTAAAISLPYLLECAQLNGAEYLKGMWNFICPELLRAIETESEPDVLLELMDSMAKCVEFLGSGCLTEEWMTSLLSFINRTMSEHFQNEVDRLEKRKDEDYDEVVEEELEDENSEDSFKLAKVADIIHALFVSYKTDFFPYFDQIIHHFIKMLEPNHSWADHQWAMCIFDDVIESGGPACIKYQQYFLGPMTTYIRDKVPQVRQTAIYGCGVLAMFGGPTFASTCAEVLPVLISIINDPSAKTEENLAVTENAVSAITKILKYNSANVNVDEILPIWFTWLPIWEDTAEVPHVMGYLCDLIAANHPTILGANHANLPRILSIFAETFMKEAIETDTEVAKRMIEIVKQCLQGQTEIAQMCISQLSQEHQLTLHNLLQSN